MFPETRAVIDVGTNSIKLTVARVSLMQVEPLLDCRAQLNVRLGSKFYLHQKLPMPTMLAAVKAIQELVQRASKFEPVSLRGFATSAVRDACNRDEFVALVRARTGLPLEVLSGKGEAEWVFRGVMSDPAIVHERALVFGFGGGSMPVIVNHSNRTHCSSFDLGAVRLMEMLRLGRGDSENDRVRCELYLSQVFIELILPQLRSAAFSEREDFTMIAAGGLATSLMKMKMRAQKLSLANDQSHWLSRQELSVTAARLWELTGEERKHIPGLQKRRADVILPGIAIVEAAMKHLGFDQIRISRRGVRYGALLDMPKYSHDLSAIGSALPLGELEGFDHQKATAHLEFP